MRRFIDIVVDSSVKSIIKGSTKETVMETNLLHGENATKVRGYLSLRGQFMNHENACRALGIDPTAFVATPKECREFLGMKKKK